MGQVWQATDTQLNRQVALKILPDVSPVEDRFVMLEARTETGVRRLNVVLNWAEELGEPVPGAGAAGTP